MYEVIEFEPSRLMVMRTTDGPFPMETTYRWSPIDDSHTRMVLRNTGNPSGFSKLVTPFISFAMRRANIEDLELLKKKIESSRR